jgi:hypothetical protein
MGRGFALPFVGLLIAAIAVRASHPPPAPPPLKERAVEETAALAVTTPPAPAPLPQPPPPRTLSTAFVEPVLAADELRPLVEARFADETILAYARVTGRPFRPTPSELASLREAGMSDALIGRLAGVAAPASTPPEQTGTPVRVMPVVAVYSPVTVTTVVEAPPPAPEPEPAFSAIVLVCAAHGRSNCCASPDFTRPAIYRKPPFFKTHAYMPTKRLPTAEDVARREESRALLRQAR